MLKSVLRPIGMPSNIHFHVLLADLSHYALQDVKLRFSLQKLKGCIMLYKTQCSV